ncbi:MAG: hypothetical protein JXB00_17685 [Bacteroidales bacterium]|nr:hypothetical protein [Bacteroidales bacterium]
MKHIIFFTFLFSSLFSFAQGPDYSPFMQKEKIGRGLVAYRKTSSGPIFITWRYFETDSLNIAFNIYKTIITDTSESARVKITSSPVSKSTFYSYTNTSPEAMRFYLREVYNGLERDSDIAVYTLKSIANGGGYPYIEIPMQAVHVALDTVKSVWVWSAEKTDSNFVYSPNDASFADLDGDGEMEIVIHRVGANAHDNAQDGYTDSPVLQAYKLDGTFMWEINLGINIREGAHYTQFMVYDLDGNGKAEVVCKTAEGTKDAAGTNVGEAYFPTYVQKFSFGTRTYNADADYRNPWGYILQGPEFLTVFNGETGTEIVTTEYDPPRYSTNYNEGNEIPVMNPTASNIDARWGDDYGNRVDRFLACVAFLDGIHPSVVMCRGYYSRTVLVAYDFDGTNLTKRWKFDTYNAPAIQAAYAGNGNHNLRVADVDGDGNDEIVYGSVTIDDNGQGLYNTKLGHGDALHLTDFIPERQGLEVLAVHENKRDGTTLRDAATGEIIRQIPSGDDVGRGMGTDVSSVYRGMEFWSSRSGGVINASTGSFVSSGGVSMNMACWWDGDLLRELQDGVFVTKYNNGIASELLNPFGMASNNSSKANPCIVADFLGDWREEVMLRTINNKAIRIYLTEKPTNYRFHTFLQDPVYRMSVVYQNVAYNQPTHTGFYMGSDLENIFVNTKITTDADEYELNPVFNGVSYTWSTGDTTKILKLRRENFNDGLEHMIKLTMNYHGFIFADSVKIQFVDPPQSGNPLLSLSEKEPAYLLTNPVKAELSVGINEPGIYDCFVYNLSGIMIMKNTLLVGGSSIQTLDASSFPSGMCILRIEKGGNSFKTKFLKE